MKLPACNLFQYFQFGCCRIQVKVSQIFKSYVHADYHRKSLWKLLPEDSYVDVLLDINTYISTVNFYFLFSSCFTLHYCFTCYCVCSVCAHACACVCVCQGPLCAKELLAHCFIHKEKSKQSRIKSGKTEGFGIEATPSIL